MTRVKFGEKWIEVALTEADVEEVKSNTPGESTPHLYRTTPDEYKRTGDLQRGWKLEEMSKNIVTLVFYALFVEFGTVKMAGHFMVTRSIPGILKRLRINIAEQLGMGAPMLKLAEIVIKI